MILFIVSLICTAIAGYYHGKYSITEEREKRERWKNLRGL